MKTRLLFPALATVGVLYLGNGLLKKHERSAISAFGWTTPASCADEAYSLAASEDLQSFLVGHGFKPMAVGTNVIHTPLQREDWFSGGSDESFQLYVVIGRAIGQASGLEVNVQYDCSDYSWRVTRTRQKAEALVLSLNKWWQDYRRLHKGGPPLSSSEAQSRGIPTS